ncbi:MAG: F-box protein [Chlamydiales bacterium]|nr:F-box protein [Chlamydiales bacterium]
MASSASSIRPQTGPLTPPDDVLPTKELLDLPNELIFQIATNYLNDKDIWSLEQVCKLPLLSRYLIGKIAIPEEREYLRHQYLRMVERLTRPPSNPLHIPRKEMELPNSLWERLHFVQTGEIKGYREAMRDLQDRFTVIDKYFTPETIFDLRNRYWCLWQLTHLSNQWMAKVKQIQDLSIDQRLDKLGVHDPFYRIAYKVVLFFDRIFVHHFSQITNPLTPLSFRDLATKTQKESVQIGECTVEEEVYQVRARGWLYDTNDFEATTFINETQIYLTQDPDVPIEDHGYHGHLTSLKILSIWNMLGRTKGDEGRETESTWKTEKAKATTLYSLYVYPYFHGCTENPEGSDRLLDLKLVQIAVEILSRSEDVPKLTFWGSRSDSAVFSVCAPNHEENIPVFIEITEHRTQYQTLFPPGKNYTTRSFDLNRQDLLIGTACLNAYEIKPWKTIIKEAPILSGTRPVIPHYWTDPPPCLQGQETMPPLKS